METSDFQQVCNKEYDVIIIGAGIGGLTAGAYLTQRGKKVLLVEKCPYAGGCICGFRHKGYYFDGGPTSVSFMKILSKVYGDLGLWDSIEWIRVHHQLIAPGLDIDISDEKALIDGLCEKYPESRKELTKLFKHMDSIVRRINPIYSHDPNFKEGKARIISQMTMPIYLFPTVYTAAKYTKITKKVTINKYLKADNPVKEYFMASGYENIATVDLSFMWDTFTGNLFYPKGGMVAMIRPLVDYLMNNGADILYNHGVKKIKISGSDNSVEYIECENGDRLHAPYYISNADYKKTFLKYIGKENISDKLTEKLEKAQVTEPILNLFLGLKISPDKLPVFHRPNSMVFLDDGVPHFKLDPNDKDFYKKVHLSVYIPSLNDPSINEPGKTSLILAAPGNYHFRNDWMTENGVRGQAYKDLKAEITETLLQRFEKVVPNIRDYIDYSSLATPMTYERYTGTWEAASCGWAGERSKAFYKNDVEAAMGNYTPFTNLMMAGQWTYFNGGIPCALTSGRSIGAELSLRIDKARKIQQKMERKKNGRHNKANS